MKKKLENQGISATNIELTYGDKGKDTNKQQQDNKNIPAFLNRNNNVNNRNIRNNTVPIVNTKNLVLGGELDGDDSPDGHSLNW